MSPSALNAFLPLLALLASVTLLGLGTSWAKLALFPLAGALGTTTLRVGFSALLMLLWWRPWRWPLHRRDRLHLLGYGAALGGMNLFFYLSLQRIPFGVAVAIEFAGPLTVALWQSRRPLDLAWVALAVTGLALLLPLGLDTQALDLTGVLHALIAAIFWALYILLGKRVAHLHAGHSVSLGLSVAALVALPTGWEAAASALVQPGTWAVALGVAALSSAAPISLEMVALKRLPAQAFGIMISMEPAVAALLAMALLQEHLSLLQWAAIALIMSASAGAALSAQTDRRRPPAPTCDGGEQPAKA
ncbi:EamA family transporter [Ideonella livida]|uniref:EamA family transporter n=1 Tax=Ideonella livida TaxID=2707176 RepID=A0A7C9PF11_9BURK|nr:EamA family transporter [Ideonella livida]NDY90048.1 EamA family transporter [Ideonella livida]